MKSILFFILITFTSLYSKSQTIVGTYANKWISQTGDGIEYVLELHQESDFTFIFTRIYQDSEVDTTYEIKGNWQLNGRLLVLNTDPASNEDNSMASDLHMNKARFIKVSPRNPNADLIKSSLKFYKSPIFYVKNMELIKTASSMSAPE